MNTPEILPTTPPQKHQLNETLESIEPANNEFINEETNHHLNVATESITQPGVTEPVAIGSDLKLTNAHAPTASKVDGQIKAEAAQYIERNPRPATPSIQPVACKPGYLPDGKPDPTTEGRKLRVAARQEEERLKKEAASTKKDVKVKSNGDEPAVKGPPAHELIKTDIYTPDMTIEERVQAARKRSRATSIKIQPTESDKKYGKTPKGFYLQKLMLFEFEQLTDGEAQKAYEYMSQMKVKSSLQRSEAIKVLFTESEYEVIKKLAKDQKIEKARVVRRLAFTGPSKEEIIAEFREIKYLLDKAGGNLNQLARYFNSKKPGLTESNVAEALKILNELRELKMDLDRRLAR